MFIRRTLVASRSKWFDGFREKRKKSLEIQQNTCNVAMTIWKVFVWMNEQSMEIDEEMCRKLKINKHNTQVQKCVVCSIHIRSAWRR